MTTPLVRAMTPDDRAAAIELLLQSDPWLRLGYRRDDWNRLFAPLAEGRDSYVIEAGREVAGIALVRRKFLLGDYLELLAVAEHARGRGLASALLTTIEAQVFARSRNFYACVSDFNTAGRAFYNRLGYREIGAVPDLLVAGSAEILLRKSTGPVREMPPKPTAGDS